MDLFEAMETLTAVRRFKTDPVPRELVERMIFYATRAASGGNSQPWEFIVLTERDRVAEIARHYREVSADFGAIRDRATDSVSRRVYGNAAYLAEHMHELPCLILVGLHGAGPTGVRPSRYGSIFPAVQNLMLAARAFGLGTVLTTRHRARETEIKAYLRIPEDVETVCLLPVGYPEREFVRIKNRRDPAEVTHWNGW